MDILHLFAHRRCSRPTRRRGRAAGAAPAPLELRSRASPGGLVEIGHDGAGFAFDNESPRHKVWLEPFELADRLVTNGEWLALHGRRRLRAAGALAVRRLGAARATRAGRAAVLARTGRTAGRP